MRNPKATMLCSVLSSLLIFGLALLFAHRDAPAAPAPPPAKSFLEVGKSYQFFSAANQFGSVGKVIEEPRDNWVKVEWVTLNNKQKETVWFNLSQVTGVVLKDGKE
jgi:hypothetical protein